MNNPKLALIPSGYKAEKVYSVLPSDGSGDFTFDRANGLATRINKEGLLEEVANDTPRLDYSNGTCPVLLLEPQSTNLVTYSNDISQSSWLKQSGGIGSAPVVTSNYIASPDGSLNASRVIFNINGGTATADLSQIADFVTASIGGVTNSIWVKSNTTSNYTMSLLGASGSFISIVVTNEWQRFEVNTITTGASSSLKLRLRGSESTSDYADVAVWGGQIEEQSFATSTITTEGSVKTRFEEVCGNAGDANLFDSNEGTMFVDIQKAFKDTSFGRISISDGSTNNRIVIGKQNDNAQFKMFVTTSGTIVAEKFTNTDFDVQNKFAISWKLNDFKFYQNGSLIHSDTLGAIPIGFSKFAFNENNLGSQDFFGEINGVRYYDTVLTEAEAKQLTTI